MEQLPFLICPSGLVIPSPPPSPLAGWQVSFIHSVKLTKDSKTELVPALWKLRGVAFPSLVCRRDSSRGQEPSAVPWEPLTLLSLFCLSL